MHNFLTMVKMFSKILMGFKEKKPTSGLKIDTLLKGQMAVGVLLSPFLSYQAEDCTGSACH